MHLMYRLEMFSYILSYVEFHLKTQQPLLLSKLLCRTPSSLLPSPLLFPPVKPISIKALTFINTIGFHLDTKNCNILIPQIF